RARASRPARQLLLSCRATSPLRGGECRQRKFQNATLRFFWKGGGALRRLAVMRRLLVCIRQLKNCSLLIWTSHESDSSREIVHCKPRRHSDRWNEDKERVEMRHTFRVHERRIHPVFD